MLRFSVAFPQLPAEFCLRREEEEEAEEVKVEVEVGGRREFENRQKPITPPPPSQLSALSPAAHLRVVTTSHLLQQGQPAAPSPDNKGKLANRSAFEVRIAVTQRRQEERSSTGSSFPAFSLEGPALRSRLQDWFV